MKSNKTMARLARAKAYALGISQYDDPETGITTFGYLLPKKELNALYKREGFTPSAELRHIAIWKELGLIVEFERFIFFAPLPEDVDQVQDLKDLKEDHRKTAHFDYHYVEEAKA